VKWHERQGGDARPDRQRPGRAERDRGLAHGGAPGAAPWVDRGIWRGDFTRLHTPARGIAHLHRCRS
jgi:hypothetical protein